MPDGRVGRQLTPRRPRRHRHSGSVAGRALHLLDSLLKYAYFNFRITKFLEEVHLHCGGTDMDESESECECERSNE